jgi:hypothetical protein
MDLLASAPTNQGATSSAETSGTVASAPGRRQARAAVPASPSVRRHTRSGDLGLGSLVPARWSDAQLLLIAGPRARNAGCPENCAQLPLTALSRGRPRRKRMCGLTPWGLFGQNRRGLVVVHVVERSLRRSRDANLLRVRPNLLLRVSLKLLLGFPDVRDAQTTVRERAQ